MNNNNTGVIYIEEMTFKFKVQRMIARLLLMVS
jgi:hypothetical protein